MHGPVSYDFSNRVEGSIRYTERTLRGGIRGYGYAALKGGKRPEIDDLAAPEGDHVLACSLREEPRYLQIDVENLWRGLSEN